MALPENLVMTASVSEATAVNAESEMVQKTGEAIVAAAALSVTELTPLEQHTKIHDSHQMTRHRAREAGRRSLF